MRNDLNQHEEVSSTASRMQHGDSSEVHFLLSTQDSFQTTAQYCYPNGACNLGNLDNGVSGFMLQGDNFGYAGSSVSIAGDINGDKLADILIGAYAASPSPELAYVGETYVVFGTNQTNAWDTGTVNLTILMNGQRGFVLQGQAANDYSGWSVSTAGDINGDGLADILVGAPYAASAGLQQTGKTYVVFGSKQVNTWGSGYFNISSLMNGQRGFVLQGGVSREKSGYSVSSAGDINGDGLPDILIGAPYASPGSGTYVGKTYVIFGSNQTNAWGAGTVNLTSLMNGQRGFVLQGQATNDHSGWSVSGAGDINGDSLADILIGAPGQSPSYAGKTYVIFGSKQANAWGSGVIDLASLINGQRGFVLQGEVKGDMSGYSVSGAGDINGDSLADILIGAYMASPPGLLYAGKTYVVFGANQTNPWGSGTLNLTNLMNGQRGFVLQGQATTDFSGYSVSRAGDINDDGLSDILVGAYGAYHYSGKTYVVFGTNQTNAWGSGTLNLTNLTDGRRGFVLQGALSDESGWSVSGAGDINGDNFADMLVGTNYENAYVVFGDAISPILINNSLTLYPGDTIHLTSAFLAAISKNYDNSTLVFAPTAISHGHFEAIDAPGISLTKFTQEQVWQGSIQFVHDGSAQPPSYNINVYSGITSTNSQPANITFIPLEILNNFLTINQGETVILTINNLYAAGGGDASLQFIISSLQHGEFALNSSSGQTVLSFTQQNIMDNQVTFTHDNSLVAPAYTVTVTNGKAITPSSNATIYFDTLPVIVNNQLFLSKGQNLLLNSDNLLAVHDSEQDLNLQFILTNVQHGHFERITKTGTAITIFLQQEIVDEQIVFIPDGSSLAPDYQLQATDGIANSEISLGTTLLVTQNYLPVNQGEILLLKASYLNINSNHLSAGQIDWKVSVVDNGRFALKNHSSYTLTSFTQQQVNALEIVFVPDNSTDAPSCTLVVTDNQNQFYGAIVTNISFDTPPWLVNNRLATYPGLVQFINSALLFAKDNEASSDNLLFLVRNSVNGHFSYFDNQDQTINQFLQKEISNNQIVFVTDDAGFAPAYQISVSDGRMNCSGCPQAAKITFDPVGPHNSDRFSWPPIATAAVVIGGVGFLLTVLRWCIKYILVPNYFEKIQTQGTERERTYRQQVILPIAKHIYDRVKFSSILGYSSETSVNDYVGAVSELVRQLENLNVDTRDMHLSAQSRLLEVIGIQTQKELVGKRSGCSLKNMKSIVTADTTPALLRASAATIARAVRDDRNSLEIRLEIREEGEEEKAENKAQSSCNCLSSLWKRAPKTPQPSTPLLHSQLNSSNYSTN